MIDGKFQDSIVSCKICIFVQIAARSQCSGHWDWVVFYGWNGILFLQCSHRSCVLQLKWWLEWSHLKVSMFKWIFFMSSVNQDVLNTAHPKLPTDLCFCSLLLHCSINLESGPTLMREIHAGPQNVWNISSTSYPHLPLLSALDFERCGWWRR